MQEFRPMTEDTTSGILVFATFITALVLILMYGLRQERIRGRKYLDEQEEFTFIEYNKEIYPLRNEELAHWKKLDRNQKREYTEGVKRALKKGQVRRVLVDGDKFMYVATEKGRKIHYYTHKYYMKKEKHEIQSDDVQA